MADWIHAWQYLPYGLSPEIFSWGGFSLRYYSVMYLVAFFLTYLLVRHRIRREGYPYSEETLYDFFVWAIVGLIVGARLGYVLFYHFSYFLARPWEILLPFTWEQGFHFTGISGMSYHGGAVGVVLATVLFCRKRQIPFWRFADLICPAIPLGYTFGRIGNFLNGELYGRATTVAWGMYFPLDRERLLRHPSQLYEAAGEGILLFLMLWAVRRKSPYDGFLLSLYLIGYGLVRFVIEFYREPDVHLGLVLGPFSLGQVLCLFMVFAGGIIAVMRHGRSERGKNPRKGKG